MNHEPKDRPSDSVLNRAAGVLLVSACGDALGAKYGAAAVPEEWRPILHGWPASAAKI